jgi:hypothetical protein
MKTTMKTLKRLFGILKTVFEGGLLSLLNSNQKTGNPSQGPTGKTPAGSESKPPVATNLNPKLTGKHFLYVGAIGLIVLAGYKVVESRKAEAERFQQQITVQVQAPTAEESVKWAIWDAKTKYYSFDMVSTNVTEIAESKTYRGKKQGGAAEVAEEKRMFGAAYDAWSSGDSFTRLETTYTCDLVITHTKPKPASATTIVVKADMQGALDTNHLQAAIRIQLLEHKKSNVLREEIYQVNRTVYGQLMKRVNSPNGIAYVWDTDERNKRSVEPTWVLVQEVGVIE